MTPSLSPMRETAKAGLLFRDGIGPTSRMVSRSAMDERVLDGERYLKGRLDQDRLTALVADSPRAVFLAGKRGGAAVAGSTTVPTSESDRHADARDSRAEVLRERVECRRGDVVVPNERRVRVEDVEDVGDQPQVDHSQFQRLCRSNVGIPEVRESERIDLRRDEHLQVLIDPQRRLPEQRKRVPLTAEHVCAQLNPVRRLVEAVRVELPLRVHEDGPGAAPSAFRRELTAVDEGLC